MRQDWKEFGKKEVFKMDKYIKQANDFLRKTETTMQIDFVGKAINGEWKENELRNLYHIVLKNKNGLMEFDFWDSVYDTKRKIKPTPYDVLACLTKYDPETFEEFCWNYGYDEDSRTAERIYFAVQKEYSQLVKLFSPKQMEELQEIQ